MLVVATTLLDAEAFPWREAAALYGARWYAELDLRAIKDTLQMGVLRGQTPAMVRKEVWAHLLAYNLIRGLMAQAAQEAGLLPWQVSFAGAVQTAVAFAPLAWTAEEGAWEGIARRLRAALAEHRVNDRPGRIEPRAQKRRPQTYPLLNEHRDRARARLTARRCAKVSAIRVGSRFSRRTTPGIRKGGRNRCLPGSLLRKVPQPPAQGDGDVLNQVGPGFNLASLQVSDHLPRHSDSLGERRRGQPSLRPHRPNTAADPALHDRMIGQMGAEFGVGD